MARSNLRALTYAARKRDICREPSSFEVVASDIFPKESPAGVETICGGVRFLSDRLTGSTMAFNTLTFREAGSTRRLLPIFRFGGHLADMFDRDGLSGRRRPMHGEAASRTRIDCSSHVPIINCA